VPPPTRSTRPPGAARHEEQTDLIERIGVRLLVEGRGVTGRLLGQLEGEHDHVPHYDAELGHLGLDVSEVAAPDGVHAEAATLVEGELSSEEFAVPTTRRLPCAGSSATR
jgi:hypothetical protein